MWRVGPECTAFAPRELSRVLSHVWEGEKPPNAGSLASPEAYRDIIRVWGVLNAYRPPPLPVPSVPRSYECARHAGLPQPTHQPLRDRRSFGAPRQAGDIGI